MCRSAPSVVRMFRRSRSGTEMPGARRSVLARLNGSPTARTSRNFSSAGLRLPRRAAIVSRSLGATPSPPVHRHIPWSKASVPAPRASLMSSRANSTFPCVMAHIRSSVKDSVVPSRAPSTSASNSRREIGWSSNRDTIPSRCSAVSASGAGSPLRNVSRIMASEAVAM